MPLTDQSPAPVETPVVAVPVRRVRRKRRRQRLELRLPTREQWRWGLLVALAYVVATIGMTWPVAAHLATHTSFRRDALLQVWVARWVQHALVTDPLHLYDANIFYPLDQTLAYTDANVPGALLMAPLYLLSGNGIFAYNLAVLGTFVLAAGGVYALVTHLTGNRAAAFLAGLAYAFLPYRYSHLHHLNLLGDAWTPWVLLALALLIARQTWWSALCFGLLLAVEAVTSFYLAFQIALVVGVALAVAFVAVPSTRTVRFLSRLAAALVLALALVLPLALPYLQVHEEQGLERDLVQTEQRAALPWSYFTNVEPDNLTWGWLPSARNLENSLFIGGVAGLGALVGIALGWRRRRALTVALLLLGLSAFILSLGPTWRPEAGGTRALPYRLLFDHVPLFRGMRAPGRFGILVNFAIVILAGCGAAWAWERLATRFTPAHARLVGRGLTAALALLILAELISVPVEVRPFDQSAAAAAPYRWLAAQPDQGPVMEFPVSRIPWDTLSAMYWSTLSWKPLVQGSSGFNPTPHQEVIHAFDADLTRPDGTVSKTVSHVTPNNVGFLQDLGVRYLVVHPEGYDPADWSQVLAQAAATGQLERVETGGTAVVFRVRPAPPAQPPSLRLEAPAVAGGPQGTAWSPTLIVNNPQYRWALIYVKAPVWLDLTWRDERGQIAHQEHLTLPVAVVGPPGEFRCEVGGCRLAGLPAPLPPADPLYPAVPGRYTLDLEVSGGLSARATLPVEVQAR